MRPINYAPVRAIFIIALVLVSSYAYALPSFQELKSAYKKSDGVLLDRHGKVIHELRVDPKGRRLDWTGLKDISPSFIKAVIHSEDRRFYDHSGVDWIAAGSAFIRNLFTRSARGASTITMQLSSLLDNKLKPRRTKRTFSQKWDQMTAAKDLERKWAKDEILEAYVNLVTFRGELEGISAAARGLFNKEPSGLEEDESLLLASLVRSPNAPLQTVSKRACLLGASLNANARCDSIKALAQKTLVGGYTLRQKASLAPHVAYALFKEGGPIVTSTLDEGLQRFAAEALKHQLLTVRSQNVNDGAVLVADNRTGDILAYVGSISDGSCAKYVDGVRAGRQAGSTLKPFLYALAFEKRLLSPASILDDSPLDVPTALGTYKPENYESDYKGMVSARTALASSLNVPAVRVVSLTGVESFVQKLRDLGFSDLESDDFYGPSIALGSADVSLYELVNAYRTLANGGVWTGLRMTLDQAGRPQRRVISASIAFLISDILSDREARSTTFGFENPLSTRFWSAVKTGTSKDMRDNWCIGYSRKYTVGVWVGNFTGRSMWNVSGVTGAAPVWFEIMKWLHRYDGNVTPKKPEGVIARKIDFKNGIEPARVEFFAQGTELSSVILKDIIENPRITYPVPGTIIAIDPDIPEQNQFVLFETQSSDPHYVWRLNNEDLGLINNPIVWKPKSGKYVLSIIDGGNNAVDSVEFEVRGMANDSSSTED